jgi:hypothetical protein
MPSGFMRQSVAVCDAQVCWPSAVENARGYVVYRLSAIRGPVAEICSTPARWGASTLVVDASRNDVRRELVFDEGDAVAQLELAFLQTLDLDDVRARRSLQRSNRGVEVAMLLQEARKLRPKLAFFLVRHFCLGRALLPATLRLGHGVRPITYGQLSRFS